MIRCQPGSSARAGAGCEPGSLLRSTSESVISVGRTCHTAAGSVRRRGGFIRSRFAGYSFAARARHASTSCFDTSTNKSAEGSNSRGLRGRCAGRRSSGAEGAHECRVQLVGVGEDPSPPATSWASTVTGSARVVPPRGGRTPPHTEISDKILESAHRVLAAPDDCVLAMHGLHRRGRDPRTPAADQH